MKYLIDQSLQFAPIAIMTMQEDFCQFENRCGHHSEERIFAEPSRKAIVADLLDASVIRKLPYEGFDIDRHLVLSTCTINWADR